MYNITCYKNFMIELFENSSMKISFYSSNNEVLTEIGKRIKSQRIAMNMTQTEMADRTNLTQKTISNLENGKDVSFSTIIDVLRCLGQLQGLDMAIPEQVIRPSQIIANEKTRERASRIRSEKKDNKTWKWGDEQ